MLHLYVDYEALCVGELTQELARNRSHDMLNNHIDASSNALSNQAILKAMNLDLFAEELPSLAACHGRVTVAALARLERSQVLRQGKATRGSSCLRRSFRIPALRVGPWARPTKAPF